MENKFELVKQKTILLNIQELTESLPNRQRYFRIPQFQRGYAWREEQINDLWQDIIQVLSLSDDKKHYTGMITLQEADELKNDYILEELGSKEDSELFYVVDGQQRLTSIFILLSEIYRFANLKKFYGINIQEEQIKIFGDKDLPFFAYSKRRKSEGDCDTLSNLLFESKKNISKNNKTYYSQNLVNTSMFFQKKIEELCSKNIDILTTLYKIVKEKLVFNIYYVSNDFDIGITFETMNNRGKQLTVLEKLKNRLLYLTTIMKDDAQIKLDNTRSNIEKQWATIYTNLGKHEQQLNDDEMLKSHWICYFGMTKKRGNDCENVLLNEQFNPNNIKNLSVKEDINKVNINDYCNKLSEYSEYWAKTQYSTDLENKELKTYIQKLNHIGLNLYAKTYITILIRTFYLSDNIVLQDKIINHLKLLERFFFIRKYIGTIKSDYSFLSSRTTEIYKLKENDDKIIAIINKLENELLNSEDYGINKNKQKDENDFIETIDNLFKKGSGYYSWAGKNYFLFEYNLQLALDTTRIEKENELSWNDYTNKESRTSLTVEHIYPQTPDDTLSWEYAFSAYDNVERFCFRNTLGNLLPLARSINAKYQNYGYWVKKKGIEGVKKCPKYENGSLSELEVSKDYEIWIDRSIDKRTTDLLNFLNNNWKLNFSSETLNKLKHIPELKEEIDISKLKELYNLEIEKVEQNKIESIRKNKSFKNPSEKFCSSFWNDLYNYMNSIIGKTYKIEKDKDKEHNWLTIDRFNKYDLYAKIYDKNYVIIYVYCNDDKLKQLKNKEQELETVLADVGIIDFDASKATSKSKKVIIAARFENIFENLEDRQNAVKWLAQNINNLYEFLSK